MADEAAAATAMEQARLLAERLRRVPGDMGARRRLDRLIRDHPVVADVRFERAALLQEQGALEAAVVDWSRGLVHAPGAAIAWSFLAVAHSRLGQPQEALQAARRALALDREDVHAQVVMGASLRALGQTIEARRVLAAAEHLDPLHPAAARHLGMACWALQRRTEAIAALARAAALHPRDDQLARALRGVSARFPQLRTRADALNATLAGNADRWVNAALAAERRLERPVALAALQEALRRDPVHPVALHLFNAFSGAPSRRPPPGYVARLFDDYADTFEAHLVGELGYRLPEALAAWAPLGVGRALDIGCGTGLLAPLLRDRVARLVGVDLSPRMLARCQERGLYDALYRADATAWLAAGADGEAPFALVVAADVLIYVGDAEPLLRAVSARLSPGGSLLLSIETLPPEDPAGVRLLESGRYAHSEAHIHAAAQAAGLRVVRRESTRLRRGAGVSGWEEGTIYSLQRSQDGSRAEEAEC